MMNFDYFNKDINLFLESMVGTIIVILAVLIFTRVFGLKSFSKMTGFDFVNTIMIGNLAAMSLSTGKPGMLMGIVIIGLVYLINYLLTLVSYKNDRFEEIISNQPILLMKEGEILHENMEKCKVTIDELRAKLREANVLQLSQAKAVVFETTGDVSVLHSEGEIVLDEWLLEDVKR